MAENKEVQLKREEIVDQEVVLSDVFPKTNTGSVIDDNNGIPLDRVLERIMNTINNKLSRVVNSVNGRTGVVVLDKGDVNLDNVDNVSFDDIKQWVLQQLRNAFGKHSIKLFANLEEANTFASTHDESYSGTPFYCDKGFVSPSRDYPDNRAHIGYFEYDQGYQMLLMYYRPISTIGATDNSILYNTNVKGDFRGGKIGVNIYQYEDALKLYGAVSGETATDLSYIGSGLGIDKSKIAPLLYQFDGCYGNGDPYDTEAFLYVTSIAPPTAIGISISLNGTPLCSASDTFTRQTFKVNDLIICNFDDVGYYELDGSLKTGIKSELLLRQPAIGKVTQAPSRENQLATYQIQFYTVKPLPGNGLSYNANHTGVTDVSDDMLSISPLQGSPLADPQSNQIYDMSGLVTFNDNERNPDGSKPSSVEYNMSTPSGVKQVIHTDETNNGVAVNPASSLCVLPADQNDMDLDNVPINTPTNVDSVGKHVGGYLGINLIKDILTVNGDTKGNNISGLRINNSSDTLIPSWFGNPELQYESLVHSGGLSVNVGDFLSIGNSINDIIPSNPTTLLNYYDSGKVNVRTDGLTVGNVGNNKLGVVLSHYTNYTQNDDNSVLGGGLAYTTGLNDNDPYAPTRITKGLTINRGLGLRMSHYDRFGVPTEQFIYSPVAEADYQAGMYYVQEGTSWVGVTVTGSGTIDDPFVPAWEANHFFTRSLNNVDDFAHLSVSVVDEMFTSQDIADSSKRQSQYGGLRYIVGPTPEEQSSIGIRVNNDDSPYGHQLRLGSKAIGIDERNVVGVQIYRESDKPWEDVNPLVINEWNEQRIYPYVKINGLTRSEVVNTIEILNNTPHRRDTVYFVKSENRRYVWSETNNQYEPMFVYSNHPVQGEWNKVYVEADIDNIDHTYIGRAYQWQPEYTVHIPLSYNSTNGTYKDTMIIDAVTASKILKYYAALSTAYGDSAIKGYYNPTDGKFYTTSGYVTEITPVEGVNFLDLTYSRPLFIYNWDGTKYVNIVVKPIDSDDRTHVTAEDLLSCDVNNDGCIDAVDASICLRYYAFLSTPEANVSPYNDPQYNNRYRFAYYLHTVYDITEYPSPGYRLIHTTDENGTFIPGLDININENQGLTTILNGDIKKSISVKIYDRTAGYQVVDENGKDARDDLQGALYTGGLRFNKDGFLGIRTNAASTYDATTPEGRLGADLNRPKQPYKQDKPKEDRDVSELGGRGLMIYRNNVLGIQLDPSGATENDYFEFDEFGSLQLKGGAGGGGKTLTFTDGASNTITYNGSQPVTITLGPGLIIEPDPEPEPGE